MYIIIVTCTVRGKIDLWSKTRVPRGKANGSRDIHRVPIPHVLMSQKCRKKQNVFAAVHVGISIIYIYTGHSDIKIVRTSGKFARIMPGHSIYECNNINNDML